MACLIAHRAQAAAPDAGAGRWWSVVVGAGAYPQLGPDLQLDGPPNDVNAVVHWLRAQQVPRAQLTVLADRVAGADGLPTRHAILAALDALPERVRAGDLVILYFAGHGSQQPQPAERITKLDGLDQTFIPRDVGRWDPRESAVEGAIRGSEIGERVAALRRRGAFVWLLFDSCHSATMARSQARDDLRLREIAPQRLGVPAQELDLARSALRDGRATPEPVAAVQRQPANLPGGYVAFYAAQTDQSAAEMRLPRDAAPADRASLGVFTYALLRALAAARADSSYREIAHRMLAQYAALYPLTTPEFEGTLDAQVGTASAPLRAHAYWPARRQHERFVVDAGELNGLTAGSLLEFAAADTRTAVPLGLLRITASGLTQSTAEAVVEPALLRAHGVRAEQTAAYTAGVARVVQGAARLTVSVAGPIACDARARSPADCLAAAAAGASASSRPRARGLPFAAGDAPAGLYHVDDPASADLVLLERAGVLHVARPAALPEDFAALASAGPASRARDRGEIADALRRAVRAVALIRLASRYPERSHGVDALLSARTPSGAWQAVDPGRAVAVGSELRLRLQNASAADRNATVLAVDERFGIVSVFPVDGESSLLRRNARAVEIPVWARERGRITLLVISESAQQGRARDLGYLAQPGVGRSSGAASDLVALLERIGYEAPATRAATLPPTGDAAIASLVLETR